MKACTASQFCFMVISHKYIKKNSEKLEQQDKKSNQEDQGARNEVNRTCVTSACLLLPLIVLSS